RGRTEQQDAEQQDALAAVDVGELAVDGQRHRRRQRVGGESPGVKLEPLELGDDPRQRRTNYGEVERRQEQHDEDAPEGQELLAAGEFSHRAPWPGLEIGAAGLALATVE